MSTNKSKIPLDFVPPVKKHTSSVSINMNAAPEIYPEEVKGVNLTAGHEELQITKEELEMAVQNPKINDITDFGDFAPTSGTINTIDNIDATQFQTINNIEPIVDNINIETKEIKEKATKK